MGKRLETVMLGREARVENSIPSAPNSLRKNFSEDAKREARSFDVRCAEHKRDIERGSRSVSPFKIKSRRYTSRQISLGTRSETTGREREWHVLYVRRHVYMHEFRARIHYVAVKKSQSGDQRNRSPANYFALAAALANSVFVCWTRRVSVCSSFVLCRAAGKSALIWEMDSPALFFGVLRAQRAWKCSLFLPAAADLPIRIPFALWSRPPANRAGGMAESLWKIYAPFSGEIRVKSLLLLKCSPGYWQQINTDYTEASSKELVEWNELNII